MVDPKPTQQQSALVKQCRDLFGRDSVKVYGPHPTDPNVRVKCRGRAGTHHMTYAPDGTITSSSLDMTMLSLDLEPPKPRNALDN